MHFNKKKNKDIWNNVMDSFSSFLANAVKICRKGSEGTAQEFVMMRHLKHINTGQI